MSKAKAIWHSVKVTVATLAAILGALAFLWVGLLSTLSGSMHVRSFVLVLSLMILLLFGCGLSIEKPIVWVPALSLIIVLLCGLGLTLYLYGWLGGPNRLSQWTCECYGTVYSDSECVRVLTECAATNAASATQAAPPAWWPLNTPTPYGH